MNAATDITGTGLEDFALDPAQPIGDQIVAHVAALVRSGVLLPGTRMPSIRALARRLGVNRNTVAAAFRELAEKGYLETRYGGGSHVRRPREAIALAAPAGGNGDGAPATFRQADWERRFARELSGVLERQDLPSFAADGQPINLHQQRPNTELFPLDRFQQCLNTVLRRVGRRLLNYGTPAGYLPLREQIALRLQAGGIAADVSQVLVVSGSQQGIDLLARAFLEPDDAVVVEAPMYSIALRIFRAAGVRLFPYSLAPEGVDFHPLEALRHRAPPKFFYAVPNFQNPTTHSYSVAERQALLAEVYRQDSLLIEDAYDAELHPEPGRWPAVASLDTGGRVVHLNTFSKTLVPALRVGYLCAPAPVVRRLTELKEMTDLSHSLMIQAAIAEFMERGYFDEHMACVSAFYRERMARVLWLLERHLPPETPFTRPDGGVCVWVDVPEHVNTRSLFEQLRARGVLVSPGELYQPGGVRRNGLRLSVANESETRLDEGFRVLGQTLRAALRRPPPGPAEQEYQPIH